MQLILVAMVINFNNIIIVIRWRRAQHQRPLTNLPLYSAIPVYHVHTCSGRDRALNLGELKTGTILDRTRIKVAPKIDILVSVKMKWWHRAHVMHAWIKYNCDLTLASICVHQQFVGLAARCKCLLDDVN
jgi:hypothetical protein